MKKATAKMIVVKFKEADDLTWSFFVTKCLTSNQDPCRFSGVCNRQINKHRYKGGTPRVAKIADSTNKTHTHTHTRFGLKQRCQFVGFTRKPYGCLRFARAYGRTMQFLHIYDFCRFKLTIIPRFIFELLSVCNDTSYASCARK